METNYELLIGSPDGNPTLSDSFGNLRAQSYVKKPITNEFESGRMFGNLDLRQTLTMGDGDDSILTVVENNKYIFGGCQGGTIKVWDKGTFLFKGTLTGHVRSVLCLVFNKNKSLLFSGSGDDSIMVWDASKLQLITLIKTPPNVGDILSMVYHEKSETLFFGCQNTSIQWFQADQIKLKETKEPKPKTGVSNLTSLLQSENKAQTVAIHSLDSNAYKEIPGLPPTKPFFTPTQPNPDQPTFVIPDGNILPSSHHGYVYSLLIGSLPDIENDFLFSGSGDGDIKIWRILNSPTKIELYYTLKSTSIDTIFSLALRDGLLYAGLQGGDIAVWDLETNQKIRTLIGHQDDVMAMVLIEDILYSGCSKGIIRKWNSHFECIGIFSAHEGMILSLMASDMFTLISGGSDTFIKIWKIPSESPLPIHLSPSSQRALLPNNNAKDSLDTLLSVLEKFVRIPTVSGQPNHQEDCRLGAKLLKNLLNQLGAQAKLVQGAPGRNPLVYGKFKACGTPGKHVLYYGHYDVVSARPKEWDTEPFILTGKDGYLYGRGVADNKGPILAAIFAVSELVREKKLSVDVSFIIEGEEESGSIGFYDAIRSLDHVMGNVDLILLSNSYWLGERIPCVTYGLRGVIHASIKISNGQPDSHSGVYGGVVIEPLIDLLHLTSNLISREKKILIPGFYDDVRSITAEEEQEYHKIAQSFNTCQEPKHISPNKLQASWRLPTFTVHKVASSGPSDHSTVIPSWARADVSMRIVPDQKIEKVVQGFKDYVNSVFTELESENKIEIFIRQASDWWLGDPNNGYYRKIKEILYEEWQHTPIAIREGGSIPTVPWLESHFQAPALHLPMGQSSDQAHLPNERLRIRNLQSGKKILKKFIGELETIEI